MLNLMFTMKRRVQASCERHHRLLRLKRAELGAQLGIHPLIVHRCGPDELLADQLARNGGLGLVVRVEIGHEARFG